jgi:nucleotide-binding universal stress UspA family protein
MHILVPLDGSLLAERAIAPAGLLAHRAEAATITLLAVNTQQRAQEAMTDEFSADVASGIPDRSPKYLRYLAQIREVRPLADLTVAIEVVAGAPAEAISAFAREQSADMIVMASHILTGLDSALWGSVAEAVARTAGVPTLIIRPEGPAFPDVAHATPFTILVPVDGTPFAEAALPGAEFLAHTCQGEILLLHVVPALANPAAQHRAEEEAILYLDGMATRIERNGVMVDRLLVTGEPSEGIANALRTKRADLIAIATHGQGGFAPGAHSIAEQVLHHSNAPMLIIHPTSPADGSDDHQFLVAH